MDLIVSEVLSFITVECVYVNIKYIWGGKPIKKFIPLDVLPLINKKMETISETWDLWVSKENKCISIEKPNIMDSSLCNELSFVLKARGYRNPLHKSIVRKLTLCVDDEYIKETS